LGVLADTTRTQDIEHLAGLLAGRRVRRVRWANRGCVGDALVAVNFAVPAALFGVVGELG
jgi:hypothetical protein